MTKQITTVEEKFDYYADAWGYVAVTRDEYGELVGCSAVFKSKSYAESIKDELESLWAYEEEAVCR